MCTKNRPLFRELNADDPDPEVTEIESLCMNCHSNGKTRLLLTKIPFYKDVVVMSFSCDECGYKNNEIQPGGEIAEKGIRLTLKVNSQRDINRQVVKSDYTAISIVELDFEIPSKSQKGEITTIEGVIDRCITGLEQDQPRRRIENAEFAEQLESFISKLKKLKDVSSPFTLVLEDISGNSFIENPNVPQKDPQCSVQYFTRTKKQDQELGIFTKEELHDASNEKAILHTVPEDEFTLENLQGEVLQFSTNCSHCGAPCETNMKLTNIPHFKEVVIMATACEACGNRTNEVKSSGGIEPQGVHIEIDINNREDLSRDLLKSETCHLNIPQLELEVGPYALSGRFTTVEGILVAMKEQLTDHIFKDSQEKDSKDRLDEFLKQFDEIIEGSRRVTLILDDPAGNSYVQSMEEEDRPDEYLRISHYTRNFEQNEELGLNDMKTENYEQS